VDNQSYGALDIIRGDKAIRFAEIVPGFQADHQNRPAIAFQAFAQALIHQRAFRQPVTGLVLLGFEERRKAFRTRRRSSWISNGLVM
jgi:hypothetical protein